MKRLLVLMAAPLLFAAGCSSSSGTPAGSPATGPAATSPSSEPGIGGAGDAPATGTSAATSTGTSAATSTGTSAATSTGTSAATSTGTSAGTGRGGSAGTSRCHTGALTLSLGAGEGAAGTAYVPLVFKNVSGRTCTLFGFPGVSWVAGDDGHQVNVPFARTGAAKSTVTLAAGAVAHATLATHDVGFYDVAQCKPVSVRGLRVYPPDETKSIFVPLATKACSVNGVNNGTVAPIAKGSGS